MKALELEPYTIQESERAAGKGSYITPQKRKIETITQEDLDINTASDAKVMKINE